MIRALMAAASGMQAQQMNVDTIANNLANVNTPGFKRSQVLFQDMLYDTMKPAGGAIAGGGKAAAGIQIGMGTRVTSIAKVFTTGKLQNTNRALDVAITGEGFFKVTSPDGTAINYTRDGSFSKNVEGKLVNADGYALDGITLSANATSVNIAADGAVSEIVNGVTQTKTPIKLYRFINPSGLQSLGRNLVSPTDASGEAQEGTPNVDGFGQLQQGTLETSNVEVVDEMVNLIVAQRAYEVNTKAVTASDEMLQATNSMKR